MTAPVWRWVCSNCDLAWYSEDDARRHSENEEFQKCEGAEHIPVVPAADYDALAKRVEELENQRDEADDALAFVRNERDRALEVVKAARKVLEEK